MSQQKNYKFELLSRDEALVYSDQEFVAHFSIYFEKDTTLYLRSNNEVMDQGTKCHALAPLGFRKEMLQRALEYLEQPKDGQIVLVLSWSDRHVHELHEFLKTIAPGSRRISIEFEFGQWEQIQDSCPRLQAPDNDPGWQKVDFASFGELMGFNDTSARKVFFSYYREKLATRFVQEKLRVEGCDPIDFSQYKTIENIGTSENSWKIRFVHFHKKIPPPRGFQSNYGGQYGYPDFVVFLDLQNGQACLKFEE